MKKAILCLFFTGFITQLTAQTPTDSVPKNFYDPERIVIDKSLFKRKSRELASVAQRAGWFVGKAATKNSVTAGIWYELPLTKKMTLLTEFAYLHKRDLLSEFTQTPFDEYIYLLHEVRGGVDLKYYLTKRYYRPFIMFGGFFNRGEGRLQELSYLLPDEFKGARKGVGVRASVGVQYYSGLYFYLSAGQLLGNKFDYLPFQSQQGGLAVGWMLGKA